MERQAHPFCFPFSSLFAYGRATDLVLSLKDLEKSLDDDDDNCQRKD